MKDKLLVLALFCSLAGLVLVYFVSLSMEPVEVPIREIESHPGEAVKIRGVMERLSVSSNGTAFLKISGSESSVDATFFMRQAQKFPELAGLRKGDEVCIIGKVSSYKGQTKLVGEKLC